MDDNVSKKGSLWRRLLQNRLAWTGLMIAVLMIGTGWIWLGRLPGAARMADDDAVEMGPRADLKAPDFTLAALEGGSIALADMQGKVVVLNFWATWCQPCRSEMPALEQVWSDYREQDLVVLAVNLQESSQRVSAFVQEIGLTFPVLLDDKGDVFQLYQVQLYPTTFFIDREGIIREVIYGGPMAETAIASKVVELLEE